MLRVPGFEILIVRITLSLRGFLLDSNSSLCSRDCCSRTHAFGVGDSCSCLSPNASPQIAKP